MEVRVAAWNARTELGNEQRAADTAEALSQLDADILLVSEAFTDQMAPELEEKLDKEGYTATSTTRSDDPERDSKKFALLTRIDSENKVFKIGNCYAIGATLPKMDLQITGTHLDDRTEAARYESAQAFVKLHNIEGAPLVLGGDLNTMHKDDRVAELLRSKGLSKLVELTPTAGSERIKKVKSLATRLIEMAEGKTMRYLVESGLEDADPDHQPTVMLGRIAVAQLDHILSNDHVGIRNFTRHDKLKQSDHLPVSATLKI